MNAEYPGAVAMFVDEQRTFIDQNSHAAIVIHKTASPGSARDIAHYFQTNAEMHSTHFVIDRNGEVVQCALLKDGAGGNCCATHGYDVFWRKYVDGGVNLNKVTISIEHCDPASDNSTPLTPSQQLSSFSLVAWLCDRYNISVDAIKTHASIDPINRARCPGNYPMDDLKHFVGGHKMQVPTNWRYDGSTLTAPNGVHVVLGFANDVLNGPWDENLMPIEREMHVATLEFAHPEIGGGQQQIFYNAHTGDARVLNYDSTKGVFHADLAAELMFLRNNHGPAEDEPEAANTQPLPVASLPTDQTQAAVPAPTAVGLGPEVVETPAPVDKQTQIDNLKSRVAAIAKELEAL